MSVVNISLEGSGFFYDTSENAGTVTVAEFHDSATNTGSITDNAAFYDSAANHGDVAIAVFDGSSQNTGTVDNAVFLGSAVNAGTVTVSATFQGSSQNTGTAAAATFQDTASNNGGTVTGNAAFEGTSTNNGGTVGGDATFAYTATNNGTVNGSTTTGNPSAGTVLSAGVTNYIEIFSTPRANGTYDVIADGNGGTTNGNYQYIPNGSVIYTENGINRGSFNTPIGNVYYDIDFVSDGAGSYTQQNQYPAAGTTLGNDNTFIYKSDGNGSYTTIYVYGIATGTFNNYININGTNYTNGTYDVLADGNGGTFNGNYQYANAGTIFINNDTVYDAIEGVSVANGTVDYVSDGSGGYTLSDRDYPEQGTVLHTAALYITIDGTQYEAGNWKIEADGIGGGSIVNYWTGNGVFIANIGGTDYYFDGNGSYYS